MIKRQKPIRRTSTVRARMLRLYTKIKADWRAKPENRCCAFPGCERRADDVHHTRGRVGKLLVDSRFWKPVCRHHHNWIRDNVPAARRLGLIAQAGQWNTAPNEDI